MTKTERRYVFDTNTLVSALLFASSVPGQCFRRALDRDVLLASPDTLDELAEVLSRDKLDRYVTVDQREEFYEAFISRVRILDPGDAPRICRDPDDDKFLALAVEGRADLIVSGDKDLLVLHPYRGISILSPSQVLERLVD